MNIKNLSRLFQVLIVMSFAVLLIWFTYTVKPFKYDYDEGLCLMRAFLHLKGFSLYKDVWMDQPPFFILILSWVFKFFGPVIEHARVVVILLSSLLLWGISDMSSKTQSRAAAIFTLAMIILSAFYTRLSLSLMVGLPAIALAILASYSIYLYGKKLKKRYLVASGVLLALGMQTKLFVAIYIPALLLQIVFCEHFRTNGKCKSKSIRHVLLWLVSLLLTYGFFAFVVTSIDFVQIFQPHLRAAETYGPLVGENLLKWILDDLDIAVMALLGCIFINRKKVLLLSVPLVMFFLGIIVFLLHKPLWYHHRVLVLIPLCWIASFGFEELCDRGLWRGWQEKSFSQRIRDAAAILLLGAAFLFILVKVPFKCQRIAMQLNEACISPEEQHVIELFKKYKYCTHMALTDSPIFAFASQLLVDPNLASVSEKRLNTGFLSKEDFARVIESECPGILFFTRFPYIHDQLLNMIKKEYVLKYAYESWSGPSRFYVLKTIDQGESPLSIEEFQDSIEHYQSRYKNTYKRYHPRNIVCIADNLVNYQGDDGGWPKNIDWLSAENPKDVKNKLSGRELRSTFDNFNIYSQIRYLAGAFNLTGKKKYRDAALKGIDYILMTQNKNGGWKGWDVDAITFNDGVMSGVMTLLDDILKQKVFYSWVDRERKEKISMALRKAISLTLKCQILVNGKKTAWGLAHDNKTFKPVRSRSYELPSIVSRESAYVVKFLMRISNPSDEVVDAIESAVQWFRLSAIQGIRLNYQETAEEGSNCRNITDVCVIKDVSAPRIWARFYDLETNRPFFSGRNGIKRYSLQEIEKERRIGYEWYGYWPEEILSKEYPRWKKMHNK